MTILSNSKARGKPPSSLFSIRYNWRAMIQRDRLELIAVAVVGAGFGIAAGKLLEHQLLGILTWAIIGAIVVSGVVYFHRSLRR